MPPSISTATTYYISQISAPLDIQFLPKREHTGDSSGVASVHGRPLLSGGSPALLLIRDLRPYYVLCKQLVNATPAGPNACVPIRYENRDTGLTPASVRRKFNDHKIIICAYGRKRQTKETRARTHCPANVIFSDQIETWIGIDTNR
ncbi:hypothetical protein EVAR_45549_1 [Eumeta japonica]|uniref:Uncharacterized protein n=1 Tax=Eumeta variegata TaxID=151549 RepID=A0A4C1XAL6_EUMVA|nr:hypothetical protein EVAR_45549_1 [Eumeta japonica]